MESSISSSKWNYVLPLVTGDYCIYNTRTGAIVSIDTEVKKILETNNIGLLEEKIRTHLLDLGFLTATDEIEQYQFEYNTEQYGSVYSSFILFPTYACNFECEYCYQRQADSPFRSMASDMVNATITFIKDQTVKDKSKHIVIKFFGGEPLLRHDICLKISKQISQWCEEENISFFGTITTNGALLHGEIFKELAPYLGAVHITLDGNKEFHDSKRYYRKNKEGSYEDIMKALQLLQDNEIYTTLRINIHQENPEGLKVLLEDLALRGFNKNKNLDLDFGLVLPENACGRDFDEDYYKNTKKEVVDFNPFLIQAIRTTGWEGIAKIRYSDDVQQDKRPVSCDHTKRKRYIIDSNGDLYLCPSRSGELNYKIGELKSDGKPIWNAKYFKIVNRNPVKYKECRECVFLPLCGSGCAIHAFEANGDLDTKFCGAIKEITPIRIKSYVERKYPNKFKFK